MNKEKIIIELDSEELNENSSAGLGRGIRQILKSLFGTKGMASDSVSIKGSPNQIKAFVDTISKEKRYIEAFQRFGDSARTLRNKAELEVAIKNFEKATGIEWPLK